ncbi:hypothetical protein Taro_029294 [Colocasia esculenta]|uniref:Uncharacterized protein n=1 Tax=Colocasia esculenta TaxID=4460 RepID=A0A843VUG1_COLES|nr:hypothetical protein [Colocasia esculenta]
MGFHAKTQIATHPCKARDGIKGEEGSPEEIDSTIPEARQEEGTYISAAATTMYSSSDPVGGCTRDDQLQAQQQELVFSLWKGTWKLNVLEDSEEMPEVRKHRALDQRLSQTSAVCTERSTSPSSSMVTSDWEASKASGPSPSFASQLAAESGVEVEELEVPLSVHTPVGTVATRKSIPSLPVDGKTHGRLLRLEATPVDVGMGLAAASLDINLGLLGLRNCPRFQPTCAILSPMQRMGPFPTGKWATMAPP